MSRGAAFGDIDNDGDVDIVVTNNNGPVRLLLNQAITAPPRAGNGQKTSAAGTAAAQGGSSHWIAIGLRADTGNRFGIGARVGIVRNGEPTLWRRARSDGSYLSASDHRVHVGLGLRRAVDAVVIEWPDGTSERFSPIQPDAPVTLRRGSGRPVARSER